jgi:hypothetical protein
MDGDADQEQADVGSDAANDLGIGGAKEPAQILALKIAEHPQSL